MMRTVIILIMACLLPAATNARSRDYHEGQVWAYATRPGEEGSLLKIQRIEKINGESIYHISVIGFHLKNQTILSVLPHEPVSQKSLDMSVTTLKPDPGSFPSADAGIEEWRKAHGGVYTISIAQTIQVLDQTLKSSN